MYFKLTKSNLLSCVLALCTVALLNCFILKGVAMMFDGYLPEEKVKMFFSAKYFGFIFLGLLLIGTLFNLKLGRLATKQSRKPHYARIVIFLLISLSLLAYTGIVDLLG